MKNKIFLNWKVGFSEDAAKCPERYVPAVVPGAVQLDWAEAEGWGSYYYSDNYKDYLWMEDVFWHYKCKLPELTAENKEKIYFVSKGIDYRFKIKVDGEEIFQQEGMFTKVEVELTGRLKTNSILEVIIYPVPKREGAGVDRSQADQCCKPAVSYGWDWHPRLVPLGIWEETYLELRKDGYILNCEVNYKLSRDLENVTMNLKSEFHIEQEGFYRWLIINPLGEIVFDKQEKISARCCELDLIINKPMLWWPNGQGEANLYESVLELYDNRGKFIEASKRKVGIRRARLVMHEGAWDYPKDFPKGRSNPPISMEINNRVIFCKGSNWVNADIFPGTITRDKYEALVLLAKDANMNMFRCWGGGIINKEEFFELCDEHGIMVWQEFPLACNNYIGTEEYLKVLNQESRSIINRLKGHASLVLWCGGNELFNAWSGMTEQSEALRLLNANCYELDKDTPFIMTSPLMGMAHGHYVFYDEDSIETVFQWMPKAENTAYTEFGCPSPSPVEYLKTFIPETELYPPKKGTAWEVHHAFNAWTGDTWLVPKTIERFFGEITSLEKLVDCGQLLQSEGYKCIFEEARRQKPRCSMALNWCYNEPWPTAANNSIINWPDKPKPAYYAVKAACRPVLASARIPKFEWQEGEVFAPELFILNDSPAEVKADTIEVLLKCGEDVIQLMSWDFEKLEPNKNKLGPIVRYVLPRLKDNRMTLVLKVKNSETYNSEYVLLYKAAEKDKTNTTIRNLNQ